MSNRKARRQKAGNNSSGKDDLGVEQIPLAQPDRSGPKAKTLFEIAEERQRELKGPAKSSSHAPSLGVGVEEVQWKDLWMHNERSKGKGVIEPHKEGTTEDEESAVEGRVMFIEAIFYSISFSMLHFTLDVLVHSQYAINIVWRTIIERTLVTFLSTSSRIFSAVPLVVATAFLPHTSNAF
ncbi:MAG: hypothetical protein M1824_005474 [Vezdaea acicularis]|nr:MAG: hypothetical protein M1824_005474 [Vezdaea acicularis]